MTRRLVGKNNDICYQTLKLYNFADRKIENNNTQELKFVGIGGQNGIMDIWKESMLWKIKDKNPEGIKLAIGITMYNEGWDEF